MRHFRSNWEKLTSDPSILEAISGYRLEFEQGVHPVQHGQLFPYRLNEGEKTAVDEEITKLLDKEVIALSEHEEGQFLSNFFTREKKDGGHRMILDLSNLNEYVVKRHFKGWGA